jgi:hypothetical protein
METEPPALFPFLVKAANYIRLSEMRCLETIPRSCQNIHRDKYRADAHLNRCIGIASCTKVLGISQAVQLEGW